MGTRSFHTVMRHSISCTRLCRFHIESTKICAANVSVYNMQCQHAQLQLCNNKTPVGNARQLHTSPCQAKRNYYFIAPYPKTDPIKDEPRTEVVESKEEFKYVERLLPTMQIPDVPDHPQYPTPSGWAPPKGAAPGTPYNILRTRFHTVPVFIDSKHVNQHWTMVKNVKGDIWTLAEELQSYLEELGGRPIPVTVNEVTMKVHCKGLYEEEVKQWVLAKGF